MIDQRQLGDRRARVELSDEHDRAGVARSSSCRSDVVRAAQFMVIRLAIMVLVLVVIGTVLTYARLLAGTRSWDGSVSESFASSRSDGYERAAVFVSRCGDTLPIVAFAAALAATATAVRRWRAALFVPVALVIEVAGFAAVNFVVQRPRPAVEPVGAVPSTFSYPSGHVAATLVCWFGLAWLLSLHSLRWLARLVAVVGVAAVVMMGWARVYLGMHHVLDVAFGVALGIGALAIAAGGLQLTRRSDEPRRVHASRC